MELQRLLMFWRATILFIVVQTNAKVSDLQEVCNMDTYSMSCGVGEVVIAERASYGRMRLSSCATVDHGHIGCDVDALPFTDAMCSGRQDCSFKVPHDYLYNKFPCPKDVTSYFEAQAACQPVVSGSQLLAECHNSNKVTLKQKHGFIASISATELDIGTKRCPWLIEGNTNQRINLTLWDFGSLSALQEREAGAASRPVFCHKYAEVRESNSVGPTTVCSGDRRIKNVYLSNTNSIEINVFTNRQNQEPEIVHFLLEYHIYDLQSCGNPPLHGNTLISKTDDRVILQCNYTGEQFNLLCKGSQWQGTVKECVVDWSVWRAISEEWSSPYGILLVVGLGALLGVIIGFALLALALVVIRRRRRDCPYSLSLQPQYEVAEVHEADDTLQVLMASKDRPLPPAPLHSIQQQQHAKIQQRPLVENKLGSHYAPMWLTDGTIDRVTMGRPSRPITPCVIPQIGCQQNDSVTNDSGLSSQHSSIVGGNALVCGQDRCSLSCGPYGKVDHVYEKPN